jgi:lysophospholipase L1-like esterase
MPLGDSITDGFITFRGGYRDRLENLLEINKIDFDFVGSLQNGPSTLSDRDHEGHSGWRIDEIAAAVNPWLTTYAPDLVFLVIGTNDIVQDYELTTAPERLSNLVGQILTTAPDSHVVVGTVPPPRGDTRNTRALEYNSTISGMVNAKVAAGQSVTYVDHYSQLEVAIDLGDNLHPNQLGYNKMAGVWFDGLLNILDNFGDYTAISDEFFVNAELTASDGFSSTIAAELVNNSSSSRSDLAFRHFVDLTELFNAGYGTGDVLIGTLNGPMVGDLTLWDAAEDVYYVEASFEGMEIAAGGSAMVEFSLGVDSATVPDSAWDAGNDWSTQYLTNIASKTRYMPVYASSGDILSGVVFA